MKVDPTGPALAAQHKRVKRANKRGSDDFAANFTSESSEAQGAGAGSAAAGVTGLLSLQEVASEVEDENRAARRGLDLLDRLDEIRHGLLVGGVRREDLQRLTVLLKEKRAEVTDPRLNAILDEIDLRAAIELAKFDQ